ncbi:MAG: protease inhibitor I42 family protein [Acidimicrobiales bacterium]
MTTHLSPFPRRALAPLLALALFFLGLTGCGGSSSDGGETGAVFTDTDSGSEITLDTGDRFTLQLASNPTTGYSWAIDDTTLPNGLTLVSSTYRADDTSGNVVGSGGVEEFVFEAMASGSGMLRLSYVRPFDDPVVPERVVEYIVRIDGTPWPPATTSTPGTTTATAPPTTTTTTSTTTTEASTTTTDLSAYESAVWPWAGATDGPGAQRFTDPTSAATSFAVDFVGFTDPVVGEFMQGDSRSGEIEVRNRVDGPATTVFVRQLGADDTWWVLGAASGNIVIDQPGALDALTGEMTVVGRARTFEGNVEVLLRADGLVEPIVSGNVTGRGDGEFGDFTETFAVPTVDARGGAAVFLARSAEDGSVWEAGVIRVLFAE